MLAATIFSFLNVWEIVQKSSEQLREFWSTMTPLEIPKKPGKFKVLRHPQAYEECHRFVLKFL
jgi:hypothetical protein